MGGDRAPGEVIAGAREARSEDVVPVLFGPRDVIAPLAPDLEIVDAPQVVGMHEKPADAAREKRDSSLFASCRAVADGNAHVVVSAGNTGAMLAAGLVEIGRLPDVSRPAIAAPIPAMRGPSILIDAGANADARPEHLMQFAHMGTIFAEEIIGLERPNVGLLSIGEEPEKGNLLTLEAHALLEGADLRFVGNTEGRTLLEGETDVVVCDGFTGNVALKTIEGTIRSVLGALRGEIASSTRGKLGGFLIRPAARGLRARLDPETTGGGYLLGLRGLVVIAHGSSSRVAIANATRMAARGVEHGLVEHLAARLPTSRAETRAGVGSGAVGP